MDVRVLQEGDFLAVNEIEAAVWGPEEMTPRSLLTVFAHHGGVVLGAYAGTRLAGVSLGFPGLDHKDLPYLHSHLLAVLPEYRNQRIGEALKHRQREYARSRHLMYVGWTYDPLMAPNAWFNLGVLGARVACLVDNAYGELDDALNRGLPTHRFWVVWDVRADTVDVPGVDGDGRRLAIPSDVGAWRRDDMARARAFYQAWFETVQAWWADGWRIVGVERGPTGVSYRWIEQGPTKEPVDAD